MKQSPKIEIEKRQLNQKTLNSFISALNKENWNNVLNEQDTNTKYNNFIETYTQLMDRNIPKQ